MTAKKKKTETPTASATSYVVERPDLAIATFDVTIRGDRLLVDRLYEGVLGDYGEMATGQAKAKPLPLTPEQVWERAKYRDAAGRDAFPAHGVRAAIRDAAVLTDKDIAKAAMNRAMTVLGDMLPLTFESCSIHDTLGRNSGMTRAPRRVVRPLYLGWSLNFQVQLLLNEVSPQQLYSLLVLAGYSIGIGNWRPGSPKGGSFGRWEVERFEGAQLMAEAAE